MTMKVGFVITSLPVGGAEVLLVNLLRRLDRSRLEPTVICLKDPGALAEEVRSLCPLSGPFLSQKWDLRVLPRLASHFREERLDGIVTVGAGDKMFWGRLAARWAGVPVVVSALHSTGWPDGVGRLNRWLTPWTDAFIAVAQGHAAYLREKEGFPESKVVCIPNGVDTERFVPNPRCRSEVRRELGLSKSAPLVGIVAAMRPEKDHERFVYMAKRIVQAIPETQFVVVGDGPCRIAIEGLVGELAMTHRFHFLGNRKDIPNLLAALDVFALTSQNEASPVSILEALSCEVPVVATRVGSLPEMVVDGMHGYLVDRTDEKSLADRMANRVVSLLQDPKARLEMGRFGRAQVQGKGSLDGMVRGYENLLLGLQAKKRAQQEHPVRYPTCQRAAPRQS